MMSGEFLGCFTEPELEAHLRRYEELRDQATNDDQRMAIDLFLLATLAKLGRDEQWTEVRQRVEVHPWFQGQVDIELSTPAAFLDDVDDRIQRIRDSAR